MGKVTEVEQVCNAHAEQQKGLYNTPAALLWCCCTLGTGEGSVPCNFPQNQQGYSISNNFAFTRRVVNHTGDQNQSEGDMCLVSQPSFSKHKVPDGSYLIGTRSY